MEVTDYNGEGRWGCGEILARYAQYAAEIGLAPLALSPKVHSLQGRRWVYPVMMNVIDGIEANDAACVRLGIEFIEEDSKFPFGKALKSNTARALRGATLTDEQKQRIRRRVFGLLRAGHIPHEYRDYAKLVRRIGFSADEVPAVNTTNPYVAHFRAYFQEASRSRD
jgi:hypothetical protein